MTKIYDVAIIGGGINGCGCAADAALRGLSVILFEKQDIASQTSSSSSKLIHGGLRYLEQYDFSLVRKALNERQTLLNIAPHIINPLRFILPQSPKQRSAWLIRMGLFLYDNLSRHNKLPRSTRISRHNNPNYFSPLQTQINLGFSYFDCATDDARLTIVNALQAKQHGAEICLRTNVVQAKVIDNLWHLTVQNQQQAPQVILAKSIINASGPWVETVNNQLGITNQHHLSLVKGSHIVLAALYEGDHAYVLQHDDKRIIFTIPYFGYTLVGTTDVPCSNLLEPLTISASEIEYLLAIVGAYFKCKPTPEQIITSWSGVRPLLYDPHKSAQTLTRDYLFDYSETPAPSISIYGGKITTYRQLSETVIDLLKHVFPHLTPSVTQTTPLPGATSGDIIFQDYIKLARQTYSWLEEKVLNHYLQTYGTRTEILLKDCHQPDDLGIAFNDTLYQREVDYLVSEEWACTSDDILWRRTKLGLHADKTTQLHLDDYLESIKVKGILQNRSI